MCVAKVHDQIPVGLMLGAIRSVIGLVASTANREYAQYQDGGQAADKVADDETCPRPGHARFCPAQSTQPAQALRALSNR